MYLGGTGDKLGNVTFDEVLDTSAKVKKDKIDV